MRDNKKRRTTRHKRIRRKISGTENRPRLCVYRGHSNIHAQLIDDINEKTLLSVSTQDKNLKGAVAYGGNVKAAVILGEILAKQAKDKGITELVFDRGGFLYHGRVKALAESCRRHGLRF